MGVIFSPIIKKLSHINFYAPKNERVIKAKRFIRIGDSGIIELENNSLVAVQMLPSLNRNVARHATRAHHWLVKACQKLGFFTQDEMNEHIRLVDLKASEQQKTWDLERLQEISDRWKIKFTDKQLAALKVEEN